MHTSGVKTLVIGTVGVFAGIFIAWNMVHIPPQAGLLLIVGLAAFYPAIRWPVFGLGTLVVILPFIPHVRRLYYLIYDRPLIDPLIAIGDTITLFLLLGLFGSFRSNLRHMGPYPFIFGGYFLYMLFRCFVFSDLPALRALAEFKFYGPPVLLFFAGMLFAGRMAFLRLIWGLTAVVGLLGAVYACVQLFGGYSEAERIWFSSIEFTTLMMNGVPRPFSFFQAPVAMADYMIVATVAIFILAATQRHSIALLMTLPLLWYAVLITSVRSNWVGLMVVIGLWPLFAFVKHTRWRLGLLLGGVLILLIFQTLRDAGELGNDPSAVMGAVGGTGQGKEYFQLFVASRTSAISDPLNEHSFVYRLTLWRDLFVYSVEPVNALLGRGTGSLAADSFYVTYLAEFGYPGFLFALWVFFHFIARGMGFADRSTDRGKIIMARGIVILDISLGVMNITGTHIHYFPGDFYFWFFNGVLMMWVLESLRPAEESEPVT